MYIKRYTNRKGEGKIEVLLSLDEAKHAVDGSSEELLAKIKDAIDEEIPSRPFTRRGTHGGLEGIKMLFEDVDDASTDQPRQDR